MLRLAEGTRIYVAAKSVDFRKAINGLAALIVEQFETSINDGSVMFFITAVATELSVYSGIRMVLCFIIKAWSVVDSNSAN